MNCKSNSIPEHDVQTNVPTVILTSLTSLRTFCLEFAFEISFDSFGSPYWI